MLGDATGEVGTLPSEELETPPQIRLGRSKASPVGVQHASVAQDLRFPQAITDPAEHQECPPVALEGVVEAVLVLEDQGPEHLEAGGVRAAQDRSGEVGLTQGVADVPAVGEDEREAHPGLGLDDGLPRPLGQPHRHPEVCGGTGDVVVLLGNEPEGPLGL